MENSIIEAQYPISFRAEDAKILGAHLKNRHSVVLIGMKRVGINNLLRFFLNHKGIINAYLNDDKNHLFIPVDLFDLVEREIFPFWTLTFKRMTDTVNKSNLPDATKKHIESLFLKSIQSQDLFTVIDSIRESLVKIVDAGFLPTIFFNRFDRMKSAATPALFDNLRGLHEATHHKIAYVFTGFRNLDQLAPQAFGSGALASFARSQYLKPADVKDIKTICDAYKKYYSLSLSVKTEGKLHALVDGYIQYLQLALISFHEGSAPIEDEDKLFDYLVADERLSLQSEELWESLESEEKEVLRKIVHGKSLTLKDREEAKYLWDTGFVEEKKNASGDSIQIFSPLFLSYIQQKEKQVRKEHTLIEFSKKEHVLFLFLKMHVNNICEREKIIEAVWPEVEDLGVSDWAVDRLVARVRQKLKLQKNNYEIQTIKTRGYKLITP